MKSRWQNVSLLITALTLAASIVVAAPVSAQIGNTVNQSLGFGTIVGWGTQDLRTTIMLVIQILLGFLGVVAIGIILYAGFLWMTSGGNPEQVNRAKRILVEAVIGLAIIFGAFAIVSFIIRSLAGATGPQAGGPGTGPLPNPVPGLGGGQCALVSSGPRSPPKRCMNSVVRVDAGAALTTGTVTDVNFQVQLVQAEGAAPASKVGGEACGTSAECRSGDCRDTDGSGTKCQGSTIPGQFSVTGARMEFTPNQDCPLAFPGLKCLGKNSTYQVSLRQGSLRCSPPDRPFQCGGSCTWQFETSDCVDITPPTIALTPVNFCPGVNRAIAFAATDDAGVDVIDFYDVPVSGAPVFLGTVDPFIAGLDELNASGNFTFDASGFIVGQHRIRGVATDFDAHSTVSEIVVNVWPPHCCNTVQDPDETGLNCGGSCGACVGANCDIDSDPAVCQPNQTACAFACSATSCTCINPPFIDYVSPATDAKNDNDGDPADSDGDQFNDDQPFGAPGNLVTIIGRNFGGVRGKVYFTCSAVVPACVGGWVEAKLADDPTTGNPLCTGVWLPDQIIVVVPVIAADGPIQVTTADGLPDTTNGPTPPRSSERAVPNFEVNTTALPGLCKLEVVGPPPVKPATDPPSGAFKDWVKLQGINLGDGTNDKALFGGYRAAQLAPNTWNPTTIESVQVPSLVPALIRVWVETDDPANRSNTIGFAVKPGVDHPVILDFSPKVGPVGQYVTIVGANFGGSQGRGTVRFCGNVGCTAKVNGDFTFPPQCGGNFWTDSRILVKVPAGADDGPLEVGTNGGLKDATNDSNGPSVDPFTVAGPIGPGICKLQPDNGQAGVTPVAITGERMDERTQATFTRAPAVGGTFSTSDGTDRLDVTVPAGAQTGDVFVTTGVAASNKLPFTVGDCRTSESCAGGGECCATGPFAGSCMPAGQCGGVSLRSAYRWHFVTGKAGPRVIEDCTRSNRCTAGSYSSPTPWEVREQAPVPVNAKISASFDRELSVATVIVGNVVVQPCNDASAGGIVQAFDPNRCDPSVTNGVSPDSWMYRGSPAYRIDVTVIPTAPGQPLQQNRWYRVTLKPQITSPSGDPIVGNQSNGDYVWTFRTVDNTAPGTVGCLGCVPAAWELYHRGATVGLQGDIYERDQVCVMLDPTAYHWNWNSADPLTVTVAPNTPDAPSATATGQAETPGTKVNATIDEDLGKVAACTIAVRLDTPVVIDRWPNCSSACVNAQIGAAFSLPLDNTAGGANSATNAANVKLHACGADFSCPLSTSLNVAIANLQYNFDPAANRSQIEFDPAASHNGGRLIPGVYYRVMLESDTDGPGPDSGLASPEGKGLGGLNMDVDGNGVADAYTWVFKVRDDFNECEVGRVDVIPPAVQAFPPTVVPYRAQPYSTPDACSAAGQRLTPYSNQWDWRSGNAAVAQMLTPLRDACGNGALEVGEECDDGNLENGDGCSGLKPDPIGANPWTDARVIGPCVAEGDGDLGNANYHQTVCGNGVVENDGDGIPGATEEQCDDGNTQDGDGCSRTCLLEGSRTGQSRCGDGIVGPGESCETCGAAAPLGTIYRGSCAASDRALNRATVSGDGCSNRCTAETDPVTGAAITGNPRVAPYPVCGNSRVDAGEECDTGDEPDGADGDGCTDQCVLTGSVYNALNPPTVGPRQFAQARGVGKTDIIAEVQQTNLVSGVGIFEVPGPGGAGLGPFQIIGFQPRGNQVACLTEQIVVRFSNPPDRITFTGNVTIDGVAVPVGSIQPRADNIVTINPPLGVWLPEHTYAVKFAAGVLDISGQSLICDAAHPCAWAFTTGTQRCEITDIRVIPAEAVVKPSETQIFEAQLVGAFKPAEVVNNRVNAIGAAATPALVNHIGCDLNTFLCIESTNGSEFTIQAKTDEACGGASVGGDPGHSQIDARGLVSLGCGLGLDFSQIPTGSRNGKWWLALAPSRQISVAASSDYRWSYTQLRDQPAVKDDAAKDNTVSPTVVSDLATTHGFRYTVMAVDPWATPLVGIRQADIRALYPPEGISDTSRFVVGNICAVPYREGNLYGLYPLQPDSETLAIGHFDGAVRLTSQSGAVVEPVAASTLTFRDGLEDATTKLGQAVEVKAGSKLVYPASQILTDASRGSFSLWYRPDRAGALITTLLSVGNPTDEQMSVVLLGGINERVQFTYNDVSIASVQPIVDNKWHLIAGSWQWRERQVTLHLTADGQVEDPKTITVDAITLAPDAEVRLGHTLNGLLPAMGALDELEISRAVWSEDEIRARHEAYLGQCLGGAIGAPKVSGCRPDADPDADCDSDAEIACTNPLISVTFDQAMDPATILHQTSAGVYDRIMLCPEGGSCAAGNTLIRGFRYDAISHTAEVTQLASVDTLGRELELKMSFDRPNFADDTGHGHTGQCSGGSCPTWTNAGRVGGGIVFDGRDDYLNAGQVLNTDMDRPFTLAAWVKPTPIVAGVDNTQRFRTIIGTDGSWAETVIWADNKPAIGVNGGEPRGWWVSSDITVLDGEWHHVVGTYDGTNGSIYVDGVLRDNKPADPPIDKNHGATLLGRFTTAAGSPLESFSGTMDDVQIWRRALSDAEVGQLYSGSVLVPGKEYEVKIADGLAGVLSATNLPLAVGSLTSFKFKIAPAAGPCACDYARILVNPPDPPQYRFQDAFSCAGNTCVGDVLPQVAADPASFGNQHRYEARCFDQKTNVAVSPVKYEWKELYDIADSVVLAPRPDPAAPAVIVRNTLQNGEARLQVIAKGDASTTGTAEAFLDVTNFVCSNPWPNPWQFPFVDTDVFPIGPGARDNKAPFTNFSLLYCRDAETPEDASDDLPALPEKPTVLASSLPKQFLFPLNYFQDTPPIQIVNGAAMVGQVNPANVAGSLALNPRFGAAYQECIAHEAAVVGPSGGIYEFTIPETGHYQVAFEVVHVDPDFERPSEVSLSIGGGGAVQPKRLPSLNSRQVVTFDLGQQAAGSLRVTLRYENNDVHQSDQEIFAICRSGIGKANIKNDAIGVQVFANPWRLAPETWYASGVCEGAKTPLDSELSPADLTGVCFNDRDCRRFNTRCKFNVPNRGSAPQSTIVDGYPAVKDGRSVYVGGTNRISQPSVGIGHCSLTQEQACTVGVVPDTCPGLEDCEDQTLFSNIYLISYNEDAGDQTKAVFDELLKNWRFNVNVNSFAVCQNDSTKACSSDLDCPAGDTCLNTRDKIRRDALRFGQLQDFQIGLNAAAARRGGTYPLWEQSRQEFSAGTFVPGQSYSVWPSWNQSLATQLGRRPPIDPINKFVGCLTPYDEISCWDERNLRFSCPGQAYVYGYGVDQASQGKAYELYTRFELPEDEGGWRIQSSLLAACFNALALGVGDGDADGVRDSADNCVGKFNPYECIGGTEPPKIYCRTPGPGAVECTHGGTCTLQSDADGDSRGDACDPCPNSVENDADHDGVCEDGRDNPEFGWRADNCPSTPNPDQRDADNSGLGDACETGGCSADLDRDGVCDEQDNCPTVFNSDQTNTDRGTDTDDGQIWPNGKEWGDACDLCTDVDDDGWGQGGLPAETCRVDNCRQEANPHQEDFDKDGQGYACDVCIDTDNDQVTDQLVANSGFEDGLNGFALWQSSGANAALRQETDYRRLHEAYPSANHGDVYRGIHGAVLSLPSGLANTHAAALRTAANPRFVSVSPDYGVRYFIEARIKPSNYGEIIPRLQLRPIRMCSNDRTTATQNGLEYTVTCQGGAEFRLPLRQPMWVQPLGNGWYSLRSEFIADPTLANNPVAFELVVAADPALPGISAGVTLAVDDFTVGFQCANCAESCPRSVPLLGIRADLGEVLYRPLDSCKTTNNPTRCVGGPFHGQICTLPQDCINPPRGTVQSVTVIEQSGGIKEYAFAANDAKLAAVNTADLTTATEANHSFCDIWSIQQECYDLFWSDADGSFNGSGGVFLTLKVYRTPPPPADDTVGHNIDAVKLTRLSGEAIYAKVVADSVSNNPSSNISAALGPPNAQSTALGNGSTSLTLDFGLEESTRLFASCQEILAAGKSTGSKWYTIQPRGTTVREEVYCDMETDGGGWTLVARLQDEDLANPNWVRQTNDAMSATWWFNGLRAPGADPWYGARLGMSRDYKAAAFDTIPLADLMVTIHQDSGAASANAGHDKEIYALWANSLGDGRRAFRDQPVWTAAYCPKYRPQDVIKSGSRGAANVKVVGIILGPRDSDAGNSGRPDEDKTKICAKKMNLEPAIQNKLTVNNLNDPPLDEAERPDIAVVALGSHDGSAESANPNPQGLGNWGSCGTGWDFRGVDNNCGVGGANNNDNLGGLLVPANFGQVWFRERPVVSGSFGVCQQPDYDEDNVGDSCDACTDRDGDTIGDAGYTVSGCQGSFVKTDNCPVTANSDQADADQDTTACRFDLLPPYITAASPVSCNDDLGFPLGRNCQFCGGDACDLDADGDACYNWERLKQQAGNQTNPRLHGGSALVSIANPNYRLYREEGYALTGTHREDNWRAFSRDTDVDGVADDCDVQSCGNRVIENVRNATLPPEQCNNPITGAQTCEECDNNIFTVGSSDAGFNRYLLDNFCAACNNLRCQATALRSCQSVPTATDLLQQCFISEQARIRREREAYLARPENRTEFVWVLDNHLLPSGGALVRRMVAIEGVDDGKPVGDTYGNSSLGTGPGEYGSTNQGDFSVTISPTTGVRVWVPYEETAYNDEKGLGVFREIKLSDGYQLEKVRDCVIGWEENGPTQSAVDLEGNAWTHVTSYNVILMQYAKEVNPDVVWCSTNPLTSGEHPYQISGFAGNLFNSIHAMEVDADNNLWLVAAHDTYKLDLNWVYDNFTAGSWLQVGMPTPSTCSLFDAFNPDHKTDCAVFKTPFAGEIAIDGTNTAWVSSLGGAFNDLYKITPAPSNVETVILSENVTARYLTVDIENNLWVVDKGDNDLIKIDTKQNKVLTTIAVPGTTAYGLAADSAGYVWVMHHNGNGAATDPAQIRRCPIGSGGCSDFEIWAQAYKFESFPFHTRSAIRTGLSPRIIQGWLNLTERTDGQAVISCPLENFTALVTGALNWQNRWGKILYGVNPPSAAGKVKAFVTLGGDPATLGTDPAKWITVEAFNQRIGVTPPITFEQALAGSAGEIAGQYLKIKFEIPTDLATLPQIVNLRITCKDDAGRDICRAP